MKVINIVWRNPVDDIVSEQFDAEKYKVSTDASWLKLYSKEKGDIARLIPSTRVRLIEFGEVADKPRILRPEEAMPASVLQRN